MVYQSDLMQRKRRAAFVPLFLFAVDLKSGLYPMRRMSASHAMSLWPCRWRKPSVKFLGGNTFPKR